MCLQLLSKVMYTVEKLTACFACLAILVCVISTLIFTIGFGVGLGYNYCFVDLKAYSQQTNRSYPKMRIRNDRPIYPYPPHRYPSTYYYPPGYSRPSTNPTTTPTPTTLITTTTTSLETSTTAEPPSDALRFLQNKYNTFKEGHKSKEVRNEYKTLGRGPSPLGGKPNVPMLIPGIKGKKSKLLEIEMGTPEFERSNILKEYFPKIDDYTFHRPSKVYKNTLVNITRPDYIPMYAPNYKPYYFKTSDNVNKTGYYIIPDTIAKANEKNSSNSKEQTVIPVSKLDFLRLLSKLSADNKNYSLQVIF